MPTKIGQGVETRQQPSLDRLPPSLILDIADRLETKDVVALAQTSRSYTDLLCRPSVLGRRIRGEPGPLIEPDRPGRPELLRQRASTDAGLVSKLRRAPLPLAGLRPGAALALSDSGRHVLNQMANGDIVALDLLSPGAPFKVIAHGEPSCSWIKYWDRSGYLWAGGREFVSHWQTALGGHRLAHFVWEDTGWPRTIKFQVGDRGGLLVKLDDATKEMFWFTAESLRGGNHTIAGTMADVADFAAARDCSRVATLHDGLARDAHAIVDIEASTLRSRDALHGYEDTRIGWTVQLHDLGADQMLQQQAIVCEQSIDDGGPSLVAYISPDGRRVVASPDVVTLLAWPLGSWDGQVPVSLDGLCGCGFGSVEFSPDGQFLSFIGGEDDVNLYQLDRASPRIFGSSSGNFNWLHGFSDDNKTWFWNDVRVPLEDPISLAAKVEYKPGLEDLNILPTEHGDEPEATQPGERVFDGTDLYAGRHGSSDSMHGKCFAVEPNALWAIAKSDTQVVAFAMGGSEGYLQRVVKALAAARDENPAP